jgi:ferrous iron transport protein A
MDQWSTLCLPYVKEESMTSETNAPPTTLHHLAVGQRATIIRVGGEKAARRRLLDMGLVTGETVTVERVAPMGDPIEVLIKGYHLSLRKQEASQITVEVQP